MRLFPKSFSLSFLLCLCSVFPVSGEQSLSMIDSFEKAKQYPISHDLPAANFFEGAVLGNGGLGAIVTTRPDAVVIYFGHNDVWDIRVREENTDKVGTFAELFKKVKEIPDTVKRLEDVEWYKDYLSLHRQNYDAPYPRPFPCGSAVIWYDRRNAEVTGHSLNVSDGTCEVYFLSGGKKLKLEIFTDMEKDMLWGRMLDSKGDPANSPFVYMRLYPDPATPPEFPKYQVDNDYAGGKISFSQVLPFTEVSDKKPYTPDLKDKYFSLTASVSPAFNEMEKSRLAGKYSDIGIFFTDKQEINPYTASLTGVIDKKSDFIFCIKLENGLNSSRKTNIGDSIKPTVQNYEAAKKHSRDIWKEYWSKSGVSIEDNVLERTWYHNLYFLRCALRPGVTCPGLFANWSYNKIGTAWHGDYHMNYNTQQPFWVTFSSNHTDLHLPYVDMVEKIILPVSKKWAKDYYGMRGAFFPHSAYPVEMNTMPYPLPTWGWEVFETPWTVQSLWWHYLYTMDKTFLKDRAFGVIKEAVLFLVDYMKRPEAREGFLNDGKFHIFPSVPPELYGLRPGFEKNYDTMADLALTKFVFDAYLKSCKILNIEKSEKELIKDVKSILSKYPEYPETSVDGKKVYVSVDMENPETVYNVPASLMNVFPGEQIGIKSSSDTLSTAINTFYNQQNEGGNDLVFLNAQAARLGVLDIEKFKRQIEYCLIPNGTCTDKVLQIHGRYNDQTPYDFMGNMGMWFENFSLPFVINECLFQSYNGELRFFPNWPKGKKAEFKTLRAAGGFLVSALWNGKEVEWIEITSEAGEPLTIVSPWKDGAKVKTSEGEKTIKGDYINIKTKPGEKILFKGI